MLSRDLPASLVQQLGCAVFERTTEGRLVPRGTPPDWMAALVRRTVPGAIHDDGVDRLSFLGNFLADADQVWSALDDASVSSGTWLEETEAAGSRALDAHAIRCDGEAYLVLEDASAHLRDVEAAMQVARQESLDRERLETLVQARDVLLHCIVHDLGGPLTAVEGAMRLLETPGLPEDERAELLAIGLRAAERQRHLVHEVLTSFRSELKSLVNADTATRVQPRPVVASVVDEARPGFRSKGVTLELNDELLDDDVEVVGESSRARRVLSNLLQNALRHSPVGSTVTVRIRDDSDAVVLCVSDEGPGIPPELASNVFSKGCQHGTDGGASGLGLFFCRLTVERWGGAVGHEPSESGGARFWVRLPRLVTSDEHGKG